MSSVKIISLAPFETSVPVIPMATPISAYFRDGASFTPSPVMETIFPCDLKALTLLAFYFGLKEHGYSLGSTAIPETVLMYARTMSFVVLAASQLFYSLSVRSSSKSILQLGLFSNIYLIGAIIVGFILQFGVISVPFLADAFKVQNLSFRDWALVFAFAILPLIVNELIKMLTNRREVSR